MTPAFRFTTPGLLHCLAGIAWLSTLSIPSVVACPFCNATAPTLSEELRGADASVIATLEKPLDADLGDPSADVGAYSEAVFRVRRILKGEQHVQSDQELEVVYFGNENPDKRFLINAIQGDQLDWSTPLPLSSSGEAYIRQLVDLPDTGRERLKFFLRYLEDADPLLAQDSYEEFARASYKDLVALKPDFDHEQLVSWINDSQVGPTHRRLYLTMLGICGTPSDVAMLEELLRYNYESMQPGIATFVSLTGLGGSSLGVSLVDELARADVRAKQQCLDALIAAYLMLKGPEGLPLVEERFLNNPQAEYTQQYFVISALRFHGEEATVIPQSRLVKSLRLLLDNPDIADQVVPDLTRWEDWEVMERLVQMFDSSEKDAWIRQPVISYLLVAAEQTGDVGTRAQQHLADIEELDPEGVKIARSYLTYGALGRRGAGSTANNAPESTTSQTDTTSEPSSDDQLSPPKSATTDAQATLANEAPDKTTSVPGSPSSSKIVIVSAAVALVLMGLFGMLLRGGQVGP